MVSKYVNVKLENLSNLLMQDYFKNIYFGGIVGKNKYFYGWFYVLGKYIKGR